MEEIETLNQIEQGAKNSFVKYEPPKKNTYLSGLITNDTKPKTYTLDSFGSVLCEELETCDEFWFSVAFITPDGVEDIANALASTKKRGIKGKILTTDYETFTNPDALNNIHFNYHENIELKMFRCGNNSGFHSKAYIFKHDGFYRVYIGSSNLTRRALEVNKEWNTKVVCSLESEYLNAVFFEFDKEWNDERSMLWNDCQDYVEIYRHNQEQLRRFKSLNESNDFQINDMQSEFIEKLKANVKAEKKRMLLISATGSGKTYAAALGVKAINAKKVLFVMNRQKVLEDALTTFRKVMPEKDKNEFSLFFGGKEFDMNANFVFATPSMITSLVRTENPKIKKDYFDFVILDEVHHIGQTLKKTDDKNVKLVSNQYREILQYFTPKLGTLGMTATPIRTDGFDVLKEFDNNVACQFTLMDSLSANLVCPFFYFGIDDDYLIDDFDSFFKKISKGKNPDERQLREYEKCISNICSKEHVEKIVSQSLTHIYAGSRLKSLIFVPSIDIGKRLAKKINDVLPEIKMHMNFKGFLGRAEYTEDDNDNLDKQIERFETDDEDESSVTYLITVDKLAEGVDIPQINQVIFLRPTMSPIVFSQQLGRGLRLGKGYLVVLDFIGNNDKMNYLLPMSLIGVKSGDKLPSAIAARHGRMVLPGGSVVTLTHKARESILKSIDKANFYTSGIFKDAYLQAKALLGRIPSMIEYEEFGNIDAGNINFSPFKNYYLLVSKYEENNIGSMPKNLIDKLSYLQWKIGLGKRMQEPLLLLNLIKSDNGFDDFIFDLYSKYKIKLTKKQTHFIYRVLSLDFEKDQTIVRSNHDCIFLKENVDGTLSLYDQFKKDLDENSTFRQFVIYLLEYAIHNHSRRFNKPYTFIDGNGESVTVPFTLYERYSYQDYYTVFEKNANKKPQFVGGYDTEKGQEFIPIFVNYNKNQAERFNYKDYFIDEGHFLWYTKERTRLDSPFIERVRKYKENNLKFLLFVRKEKNETKEFYFLGSIKPAGNFEQETKKGKDNKETDVVKMEMILDTSVEEDLFQNITFQDGLDN